MLNHALQGRRKAGRIEDLGAPTAGAQFFMRNDVLRRLPFPPKATTLRMSSIGLLHHDIIVPELGPRIGAS
jgi:hypothetical protein